MIDNKGVEKFVENHMSCPECGKRCMRHHLHTSSRAGELCSIDCESCGYTIEDDYTLRMFWEEMFKSGVLIKREEEL